MLIFTKTHYSTTWLPRTLTVIVPSCREQRLARDLLLLDSMLNLAVVSRPLPAKKQTCRRYIQCLEGPNSPFVSISCLISIKFEKRYLPRTFLHGPTIISPFRFKVLSDSGKYPGQTLSILT